jgi:hypothetical protein
MPPAPIRHAAWNCTWTEPTVEPQPAAPREARRWVCVRRLDARHLVTDNDCRDCPRWELRDDPERCFW